MPAFSLVTGADFRRSMDWAKNAPKLRDQIMKPKLIQRARFAAGAGGSMKEEHFTGKYGNPNASYPVICGATVEIGTVRFESARPTSAANAEFINRVAEEACK